MSELNIKFKIYGKKSCGTCHDVHHKMEYFRNHWLQDAAIDYYDMETVDGLAEGAYNDVSDIPTVVLEKDGKELGRWIKIPPTFDELKTMFSIPK
ncbi:MAG: hypothetical protein OEW70_01895 [candidate division WOR-3 bacterium]|nr:hypothetical protein [candidate division WOR-3 bacterium]